MRPQRQHATIEDETQLHVIGVPSSAGAYAPGQERTPSALREAGLFECLRGHGIGAVDMGDTDSFRWRADKANPRAMNWEAAGRSGIPPSNSGAGPAS